MVTLFARRFLLSVMLILMGLVGGGYAPEGIAAVSGKPAKSLAGTWHSAAGEITFKANGTVNYEGKRYFYAAGSGGLIQLHRKGSNRAIAYQLTGNKLTLTVNGKARVYYRKR